MKNFLPRNLFQNIIRLTVGFMMSFAMLLLTATSFLETTSVEVTNEETAYNTVVNCVKNSLEAVVYHSDSLLINLLCFVDVVFILLLIMPFMQKKRIRFELMFIFVWTMTLGIIWVHSAQSSPTEDSFMVVNASHCFAKNDFSELAEDQHYFRNYSFQLGYVFFNEILIRIHMFFVDVSNYLFIEYLNCFFLAMSYIAIILSVSTTFRDERVRHFTVLFLALSVAPVFLTTFTYGIIPGFFFATWAIYFELKFFEHNNSYVMLFIPFMSYFELNTFKNKKKPEGRIYGLMSALSIAIAVMIKSNYMIFLVAMMVYAFINLFDKKNFFYHLAYVIIACVLSVGITPSVCRMYEVRSGQNLGDSIPIVSWFVMGMEEGEDAPGWYNVYSTVTNFENSNFNAKAAAATSKERLRERLTYFWENEEYANDFFGRKFKSQWNETTYESIWNVVVRAKYKARTGWAKSVCDSNKYEWSRYMDYYAQFIFFCVLAGCVSIIKRKNFKAVIFPMIILGGMMYHMIAEAKSQYSMPYFILMSAYAGYGFIFMYDHLPKYIVERISDFHSEVRSMMIPSRKAAK